MTSSIRSNAHRWLAAMFAVALVLGLLVGSSHNTAQAIDPGQTDIAYVADGYNFPDALMGATLAGLNTAPMLGVRGPTSGDVVPPETAAELDRLTNDKANLLDTIYVFGGPAAVSDKVVGELGVWANNVTRIAGANRFATMTEISEALPSKARDSDLLDGMDSTDFALSDQACPSGQVQSGVAADGTPTCVNDAGGDNSIVGQGGQLGYAWSNRLTDPEYTPPTTRSFNSSGGAIIARTEGVGMYSMEFDGLDMSGGHVQVTRYAGDGYCNTLGWGGAGGGDQVHIRCYDETGAPEYAYYTVMFMD